MRYGARASEVQNYTSYIATPMTGGSSSKRRGSSCSFSAPRAEALRCGRNE